MRRSRACLGRTSQDTPAAVIRLKRHPAVRSVLGELISPLRVLGADEKPSA